MSFLFATIHYEIGGHVMQSPGPSVPTPCMKSIFISYTATQKDIFTLTEYSDFHFLKLSVHSNFILYQPPMIQSALLRAALKIGSLMELAI